MSPSTAFVVTPHALGIRHSSRLPLTLCRQPPPTRLYRYPVAPRCTATPPPSPDPLPSSASPPATASPLEGDDNSLPASLQGAENGSATAQAILDDVAANPEYYLNVSGVLLGVALSVIVLSATVVALDSIPVIPDVLRVVGLIYIFWFLGKFLFSPSERQRLTTEVDEFVAGVRGGEFKVIGRAPESGGTTPGDRALVEGDDPDSS